MQLLAVGVAHLVLYVAHSVLIRVHHGGGLSGIAPRDRLSEQLY